MPTKINRFGPSMSVEQILRTVGEVKQAHPEAFASVTPTEKQRAQMNRWLDDKFKSKSQIVALALALMLSMFTCSAAPATQAYAETMLEKIAPAVEADILNGLKELAQVDSTKEVSVEQYDAVVNAAKIYTRSEIMKVAPMFNDYLMLQRHAQAVYKASLMAGISTRIAATYENIPLRNELGNLRIKHAKEIKEKNAALEVARSERDGYSRAASNLLTKATALETEVARRDRNLERKYFWLKILAALVMPSSIAFIVWTTMARNRRERERKAMPYGVKPA